MPPTVGATGSSKHVLVVDDDAAVLTLLQRALSRYRVSATQDPTEALTILSGGDRIDLLVTDYMMPGMTGKELAQRARAIRVELPVLLVTGHGSVLARAEPEWWKAQAHLRKPFEIASLRDAVAALIGPP